MWKCRCWATQHGNLVHLFERDCSVQRRNQKVRTCPGALQWTRPSAPSCANRPCAQAREANYSHAGTVEYLFDDDTDSSTSSK
uniref:ATP-binding protein n=1 Tax=Nitrogeniibacter aestuarii TaxID=2815343 RepID=UPI0038B396B9